MLYYKKIILIVFAVACLAGCDNSVDSPRGFNLPKGDIEAGKQALLKHQCLACHSVEGIDASDIPSEVKTRIRLGSNSPRITTYAELLTSIINPSHRISKGLLIDVVDANKQSIMLNYNDIMTVSELVDLVTYLQPKYGIRQPQLNSYSNYKYQ